MYVQKKSVVKPGIRDSLGAFIPAVVIWFYGFLYWLYLLNLGIGLFNLVALGPIDGGRMLLVALKKCFKKEKAEHYWKVISVFFLVLIVANILFAFIR